MVKICQYFVGNDNKYLELCKEVEKINSTYAKIHKYEYRFDYTSAYTVQYYYKKSTYKEIIAYKIRYIYENLFDDSCDFLVFIDADAAISNPIIKIEDLIDDIHEIYLSRGNEKCCQQILFNDLVLGLNKIISSKNRLHTEYWEDILKTENIYKSLEWLSIGSILMNGGFFIIKNTDKMKKLFNDTLTAQKLLMDTIYTSKTEDERALGLCLLKKEYNDTYAFLYPEVQGARASRYENQYNEDKTFILHEYGQATTKQQKIDAVKALWNNKFWKNIEKP